MDQKMINLIRSFFIVVLCCSYGANVSAQTAAILPPGKTTFFDSNGKPLNGGKAYFYVPGTDTLKSTWQDGNKSVLNTNPVTLDAAGRGLIYGDGQYRQVIKDRNGNLIWDAITASTGSGGGGGSSTGDGDLVGTIKPWAGLSAPNQYLFAYGQEISRTTYSTLYTAITLSTSVFCTNGSPILTGIADTTQIPIGSAVEVSCMAPNTTVSSKTSNSVTVNNNASLTTSATAVFLPWGGGNGSTTFNLPDLRGRVVAGRDNMGGTAASRLTATYFANANAIGATGGTQSKTLVQGNLPNLTLTTTISAGQGAHTHTGAAAVGTIGGGSVGNPQSAASSTTNTGSSTLPAMSGTTPTGGSDTPFSIVQPTITSNYIIKVTPDTAGTTNVGVTSLGGMTGDISCGSGLLCTGNVISADYTGLVINSNQVNYTAPYSGGATITQTDYNKERVSIIDFGGVPDTSSSYNSGNASTNATALNNALAVGKCVFFPYDANGYSIAAATVTLTVGQCMEGENQVVLKSQPGSNSWFLRFTGTELTTGPGIFQNFSIDLNGSVSGSTAIRFGTSSGVVYGFQISQLICLNAFECIGDEVHATNYIGDIKLYDIRALKTQGRQFYFKRSRGFIWIDTMRIDQTTNSGQTVLPVTWESARFEDLIGIEINRFDSVGPLTTTYQSSQTGLVIAGSGSGLSSVWLNRVLIDNISGNGINISDINFLILNWVEAFANLGYGINISGISNSQLSNIFIRGGSGLTGANANAAGFKCTSCLNTSISNLMSVFNTGNGVEIVNSTDLNVTNIQSNNNTLWGLNESGTSDRNIYLNSNFSTNTSGNSTLSGTNSRSLFSVSSGVFDALTVPSGGTGLKLGTSGGIPYFNSTTTMASSSVLTANLPVIGGGAGSAPTVGSRTGNTTTFATFTGTATSGDCVNIDASGNLKASGSACGGGGGSPGGSNTQVQFNNAGSFGGSANLTWVSPALTIGLAGSTTGQLKLTGSTSGTITINPQATAGTATLTLPNSSGTVAVSASSPLALSATTGDLTCSTCLTNTPAALTKTDDTNVTLTLGGTPTTALLQATSLTLGWTGILASSRGGTNNAFFAVSGPTTSTKTFTFPNASATVLTDNAAVTAAQGGTGQTTYTIGDILSASASTTLSKIAAVASGQVLASAGTGTLPAWTGSPYFSGQIGVGTSPSGIQANMQALFKGSGNGRMYIGQAPGLTDYTGFWFCGSDTPNSVNYGLIANYNGGDPWLYWNANSCNSVTYGQRFQINAADAFLLYSTKGAFFGANSSAPTLAAFEVGMTKISASGSAPGAGVCKEAWVAGTAGGSCKKIAYCGTSTTPVTIIDNVGSGC